MAQKVSTILTCDLHGDDTPAEETVTFGYDGYSYSFELCESHLEQFSDTMQGYIGVARQGGGAGGGRGRRAGRGDGSASAGRDGGGRRARSGGEDLGAIREWARSEGYTVSGRGRISTTVREAYEAAHSG